MKQQLYDYFQDDTVTVGQKVGAGIGIAIGVINLILFIWLLFRYLQLIFLCDRSILKVIYKLFIMLVFPPLMALEMIPSCEARAKIKMDLFGRLKK